ncbi:hypothetical protein BDA96_09G108400 [Sorghum bicolor]|uniref:Uncharacterized protein n=2 Tax=Sorghum bicolor TaxID=4558 RepID=A0A921U470_SORBI|nr:hypothetical protein BDA96_09G108400 [Sorghum bicolor]KXG21761.1 hypothetical protein SORBI_3009G104300 [Sorghum bicolor]
MPLRWWPRQQGPFPSSGRGMAIARAVLLDDNSDRDPSPLHQQQQRPISTSPACSCRDGSPVAASSGPFPCSSGTAPTRLRSLVDPGTDDGGTLPCRCRTRSMAAGAGCWQSLGTTRHH